MVGDGGEGADWNLTNLQATSLNSFEQFHLRSDVQEKTGFHEHRSDRQQCSAITAQIGDGLVMQGIAPDVQSDEETGVNQQGSHGISSSASACCPER